MAHATSTSDTSAATAALARVARRGRTVVAATARNLAAPDRRRRVSTVVRAWTEMYFANEDATIPERYLVDLWPAVADVQSSASLDISHWWELPYGERTVIDAIVRLVRPSVSYEFGTFSGSTTVLIADAAPAGALVHTIDVPEEMIGTEYLEHGITPDMIGGKLLDRPATGATIRFHRQMIEDFDFAPLRDAVQFVFVDASHDYEDVRADSRRALEMLGPDGVIVWDDYGAGIHPGVTRALDELSHEVPLARIASTRLVVHGRGRFRT